jgi:hypothetical protein
LWDIGEEGRKKEKVKVKVSAEWNSKVGELKRRSHQLKSFLGWIELNNPQLYFGLKIVDDKEKRPHTGQEEKEKVVQSEWTKWTKAGKARSTRRERVSLQRPLDFGPRLTSLVVFAVAAACDRYSH